MEKTLRQLGWLSALVLALTPPPLCAEDAGDDYAVAAGHYAAQRWDLALEQFRSFLEKYPNHTQTEYAQFYLGETLVQLGRFDEARETFARYRARFPNSRFAKQALFRGGESAYLSGKPADAKADLARFHEQHPEDPLNAFVLPYLAEIALAEDDTTKARTFYADALQSFPTGPLKDDCQLGMGKTLEKLGRLNEAERRFRMLAENLESPLADQAQLQLGLLYYRAGKHDGALKIWKSFEEQFPNSIILPQVTLGRGWALYRLERYGEAQEHFASLVQDETVGIEAQYWLGLAQRIGEQWKRSAETLVSAAANSDEHRLAPAIRFHAGDSLLHVGDQHAAQRQFDLVLEKWPRSKWAGDSLYGLLQIAFEAGNHGDVDRIALQFQKQFPNSPLKSETYLLRASALKALERNAEAVQSLKVYLDANPTTPQAPGAWSELILCHLRLKQLNEAKAAYEKLLVHFPKHEVVLPTTHHLAEAAYASGDRSWSSELFKRLTLEENPAEYIAKGLSGLAWSRMNAEDLDGSAALFHQLLKEHPDSPLASEAALTRGHIFQQQSQADAALAMYHLVIQDYPESKQVPDALMRAARIHDEMQQDQQSATLYQRLVGEYPKFPDLDGALYGWAWVLMEMHRPEEANQRFDRIHRDFPDSEYWSDSTFRLAKSAAEQEEFDLAASLLAKLVQKDREIEKDVLAHALYLQGRVASRRELWDEVEAPMTRLIEEIPDSPLRLPAEYSIAEAAYRQEKYESAGKLLDKLAKQIEGRNDTWLAMIPLRQAQVLGHEKKWDLALEVASRIATNFPDFQRMFEADYLVGRCLAAKGDFVAARESYRGVIQSPEGSKTETAAMAQWMIGETYFHQKDYATARREFLRTEILHAYPKWQAGAVLQAGKCHELSGQWKEAAELYTRLLQKYPNTEFTEEATRRLRVAQQRAVRTGLSRSK